MRVAAVGGSAGESNFDPWSSGPSLATLLIVLGRCTAPGVPVEGETNYPATGPSATPSDLTMVDCSQVSGAVGGTLTGLAAMLGTFRAVHGPQSTTSPSEFGATMADGPNAGLPILTARCNTDGLVVSVDQNLAKEETTKTVKASDLPESGLLPADATLVSDRPLPLCEVLTYRSATIAAQTMAHDPYGSFIVELVAGKDNPDLAHIGSLALAYPLGSARHHA